ncbi:hypothetical protein RJ55_04428 [Drechmeria coniospora]|nr:hypothetical protein RJ55_04428 [Drechmeria coniospora]
MRRPKFNTQSLRRILPITSRAYCCRADGQNALSRHFSCCFLLLCTRPRRSSGHECLRVAMDAFRVRIIHPPILRDEAVVGAGTVNGEQPRFTGIVRSRKIPMSPSGDAGNDQLSPRKRSFPIVCRACRSKGARCKDDLRDECSASPGLRRAHGFFSSYMHTYACLSHPRPEAGGGCPSATTRCGGPATVNEGIITALPPQPPFPDESTSGKERSNNCQALCWVLVSAAAAPNATSVDPSVTLLQLNFRLQGTKGCEPMPCSPSSIGLGSPRLISFPASGTQTSLYVHLCTDTTALAAATHPDPGLDPDPDHGDPDLVVDLTTSSPSSNPTQPRLWFIGDRLTYRA